MNKKNQFYLMAAIIIIGVILIITLSFNYIRTKEEKYPIYSIKDVIELETAKVIDYGIVNKKDLNSLIEIWITNYTEYSQKYVTTTEGIYPTWLFIYGDKNNLKAIIINSTTGGEISMEIGREGDRITQNTQIRSIIIYDITQTLDEEGKILINVPEINFYKSFNIKEGQNFYFVITTGNQTVSSK
ncbi:MAG: hypothetical protein QW117_02195 [Candidatus Pacearchaeota archaeon]